MSSGWTNRKITVGLQTTSVNASEHCNRFDGSDRRKQMATQNHGAVPSTSITSPLFSVFFTGCLVRVISWT